MEATLDYSPNPSAPEEMTLHMTAETMETASYNPIERFVRVWIQDRSLYAPKLKRLHLVLYQTDSNKDGIARFVEHCQMFLHAGTTLEIRTSDA
jgi:hypothetical protein